jgi:hypothetical protein
MAKARSSSGKISLTVRYAALAADEAIKKMMLKQIPTPLAPICPVAKGMVVPASRRPAAP